MSSHQVIVSRSDLEEEKRQEGLQKSDHSCSDAIAESKEDTTSLGQSLRELKMDMAKSQNPSPKPKNLKKTSCKKSSHIPEKKKELMLQEKLSMKM